MNWTETGVQKAADRLIVGWLLCYASVCYANTTLAEDIFGYDYVSLGLAAAAGILGGGARTIYALLNRRLLVADLPFALLKDSIVGLMSCVVMFLIIRAWNEAAAYQATFLGFKFFTIPRDFRILIIILSGASAGKVLRTIDSLTADAVWRVRNKIRGNEQPATVSTDVAPLENNRAE